MPMSLSLRPYKKIAQDSIGDESDDVVDMHLDYRDNSIDQRMHALKTAVILRTGKALELISGSTGDTKKSVVSVMAEVIQTR